MFNKFIKRPVLAIAMSAMSGLLKGEIEKALRSRMAAVTERPRPRTA